MGEDLYPNALGPEQEDGGADPPVACPPEDGCCDCEVTAPPPPSHPVVAWPQARAELLLGVASLLHPC